MPQNEVIAELPVQDEYGRPINFGWARQPFFVYNPPYSGAPSRTREFEADRYIIYSAAHLLVFEIYDGGSLGHVGISVVSLKDQRRSTQSFDFPQILGRFELPHNSESGSIRIRLKRLALDFIRMNSGARIIKVDIPRFGHHRHLRGEVVLLKPEFANTGRPQSIVTNSPWRREKDAFRYFRCSPWYVTEGVMQFGSAELYFTKDKAWGLFDWMRGVRPRQDIRYWAAACGMASGHLAGFNVGYGSDDTGAGTENAFFLDGILHKLDEVSFHIPPTNWLEEWKFTSNDNRLTMTFVPDQERSDSRRLLLHSVKRRQVCGTFSGRVILDSGGEFSFWHIRGFAERVKTRF
jgi:hypothetical protein